MSVAEILTIIITGIGYLSMLIGMYINTKVKMKEMEVRILNLESDLTNFKNDVNKAFETIIQRNSVEHDKIYNRLDDLINKMFEDIQNKRK